MFPDFDHGGGRVLSGVVVLGASAAAEEANRPPASVRRSLVRRGGDDGVHTSRIPALVVSPQGTLVAAFDLRHQSAADLPGDIDVAIRRSADQGTTWGPVIRALDFDADVPGTRGNGIGDPNLFVDRVSGTLFITAMWARDRRREGAPAVSNEMAGQVLLTRSTDGGRTWNAGRLLNADRSGYSCMAVLPDGTVGLLYETGKTRYSDSLEFDRFPLRWILDAGSSVGP